MSTTNTKSRRPKLVWVVFLYYVLTTALAVGSFLWLLSHKDIISPQALAAFEQIPALGWVFTVVIQILTVAGAIALFVLRRAAFPLLVAALCVSVFETVLYCVHILPQSGNPISLTLVIVWAIDLAVILYARSLRNRQVLT
jgi:hypothetical protein